MYAENKEVIDCDRRFKAYGLGNEPAPTPEELAKTKEMTGNNGNYPKLKSPHNHHQPQRSDSAKFGAFDCWNG